MTPMRVARNAWPWIVLVSAVVLGTRATIGGLIRGRLTLDIGIGRSIRPLGPITIDVAAPRDIVFDVAAAPYGPRPPAELRRHVEVLQRSPGMVLAAHRTPVGRHQAVTVEGVVLERPSRIGFHLVRGPVPHVVEEFRLEDVDGGTELTYEGELGTDLWALGRAWGNRVAAVWEDAVRRSLDQIRDAAEGRARSKAPPNAGDATEG